MHRRVRDCSHINSVAVPGISRISHAHTQTHTQTHTHTKSYHSQPLMKSAQSSTNTCTRFITCRISTFSRSVHRITITADCLNTVYLFMTVISTHANVHLQKVIKKSIRLIGQHSTLDGWKLWLDRLHELNDGLALLFINSQHDLGKAWTKMTRWQNRASLSANLPEQQT